MGPVPIRRGSFLFILSENNLTFIVKKLLTKINRGCSIWPSGTRGPNMQLPEDKEINYMEEKVKIGRIKKSSKVGQKVSNILFVVCLIASIGALIAGIYIFSMGKKFDAIVEQAIEDGIITEGSGIGTSSMIHIEAFDVNNLHSDIPAWQVVIDDHPYAVSYGASCLIITFAMALAAVMMKLLSGVFAIIIKEDNPFTDKVIKRITIVMIVVSVLMFFTTGMAYGVLGGIITWVVYSILDYGKTLQIQSDETL